MQRVEHESALYFTVLQVMSDVAQRMQLRHPNIATVMGVASEPVTEDPLLVIVTTMLCQDLSHDEITVHFFMAKATAPGLSAAAELLIESKMFGMLWSAVRSHQLWSNCKDLPDCILPHTDANTYQHCALCIMAMSSPASLVSSTVKHNSLVGSLQVVGRAAPLPLKTVVSTFRGCLLTGDGLPRAGRAGQPHTQ